MSLFVVSADDLGRKAGLFPLYGYFFPGGDNGWTWREVFALSNFTLWMLVVGNLAFAGWMFDVFGLGVARVILHADTYTVVWHHPQILAFYGLVVGGASWGLYSLWGAIRLTVRLTQKRRRG